MTKQRSPGAATPETTVQTLAVWYAASTVSGLLVALGSDLDALGRAVAGLLVVVGVATVAALLIGGRRLPGSVLDGLVVLAVPLVTVAVLVPRENRSALVLAALLAFMVVNACYFYPLRIAIGLLVLATVSVDGALLLRGDVPLLTVLALDVVLTALAVVTRYLAARTTDASRDPLTGLPNRRRFDDLLQLAVARPGPLSVALLDLDHFKDINDTAGHEAGDRVLLRVADLPPRLLDHGAVLARHGGDEFALLLPGRTGTEAALAVRRICAALPGVGLSCGVAEYRDGDSAAQLMRRADGALYAAKAGGRGRVDLAADSEPVAS